jgi:hypothetical protein
MSATVGLSGELVKDGDHAFRMIMARQETHPGPPAIHGCRSPVMNKRKAVSKRNECSNKRY